MDPWPFVTAAYGITLALSAAITLWSWRAMVAAERGGK